MCLMSLCRGRGLLIVESCCKFNDLERDILNLQLFDKLLINTILDISSNKSEVNLSDVIWNNQNLEYQGKILYFNQWIRHGIICMCHKLSSILDCIHCKKLKDW